MTVQTMKKQSISAKHAELFMSNKQHVMAVCQMSELEYHNSVEQLGRAFLGYIFDEDEELFYHHIRNKKYWQWFTFEFKKWQRLYLEFADKRGWSVTTSKWKHEMDLMRRDDGVECRFYKHCLPHLKVV